MARLNQISALCSLAVHLEASWGEILAFQSKQLRRLVAHAYANEVNAIDSSLTATLAMLEFVPEAHEGAQEGFFRRD